MHFTCLAQWASSLNIKFRAPHLLSSSLVTLAALMFFTSSALAGETVVYPGAALGSINGVGNSLATNGSGTGISDSLSGNSVTVNSGTVSGDVYGAINIITAATASNNNVFVNGGTIGSSTYGAYTYAGLAEGNTVTLSGGQANDVYGGRANSGTATGNAVTLSGGQALGNVYGGYSDSGAAWGNSVTVNSGSSVASDAIGGRSQDGDVWGNTVTINAGGSVSQSVLGGNSIGGSASDNTILIDGGTVTESVFGGNANISGEASGNVVTITNGGSVGQLVYGGRANSGAATGNTITVTGGTIDGIVYGGNSNNGQATGNTVTLNGGTFGDNVYGGFSSTNSALGNTVNLQGGQVDSEVHGGYAGGGSASSNQVTISAGTTVDGPVYGGSSGMGTAEGNSVTLTGGTINNIVYGGYSMSNSVIGNTVTVSGGVVNSMIYGGSSGSGAAMGNTVAISGGVVDQNVYGGYSSMASATGNTVIISGGTINTGNFLYGGSAGASGTATGNTITLSGGDLTDVFIAGGFAAGNDAFSGNRLNVLRPNPSQIFSISNFQFYSFVLPAGLSTPMLTTDGLSLTDLITSQVSQVDSIGLPQSGPALKVGDKFTLIASSALINGGAYAGDLVQAQRGICLIYDMDVNIDETGHNLVATILSVPKVNPRSEVPTEGRAAGLAFVNQGADLVTGPGLSSALAATEQTGEGYLATFLTLGGSNSRYNTGSHVDVNGLNLMTGLSWRASGDNSLLMAAFFEGGRGDYDSYNSFSRAASVKGQGDTSYYGGGLIARYGLTQGPLAGLYGEASFRAGRVSTDFFSRDLASLAGVEASYDSSSSYYGAHGGLGYIFDLNEESRFNFSTKYLWTRQGGDRVNVAGDPFNFQAATSHRWRNGARYTHDFTAANGAIWSPFVGAALDYEFDGEAKATAYGYQLPSPSLKGGTGVGELGLSFKPAVKSPLSLDVGLEGYSGVREGVSGSFRMKFEF